MIKKRDILQKKRNIFFKKHKKKILYYYNKGYSLGLISRTTFLDISTVLYILSKCKISNKKLYPIYEKQMIINENYFSDILLKTDRTWINRYFPSPEKEEISLSYFLYWKKKNELLNQKRDKCKHIYRHIACATCGKILQDATNIILDKENVITK